ncbi:MAG TPA: GntR family transcriptional regulator, partial [Candidatus Binatia bacterium]|nr:GntR family transcriptional regulator [Candidatus Binatia bacterium]
MKELLQYTIAGAGASEIAASIERGVRAGRIAHGATLPPVRALASSLKVSPATVAAAYRALRLRGLVSGRRRQGTRVSHRPPPGLRPAV